MRSIRVTTSIAMFSGNNARTRDAWSDFTLDKMTATVCGYSFFR